MGGVGDGGETTGPQDSREVGSELDTRGVDSARASSSVNS